MAEKEFRELVARMRSAQRRFFRGPAAEKSRAMAESIPLERQVDAELRRWEEAPVPSLFPEPVLSDPDFVPPAELGNPIG